MVTLRGMVGAIAWLLPVLAANAGVGQLTAFDSGKRAAVEDLVSHCICLSEFKIQTKVSE